MIEVVFADKSASKLGLLVRQPAPPAADGDPGLASALLFAILERNAGFPEGPLFTAPPATTKRARPHVRRNTPATDPGTTDP